MTALLPRVASAASDDQYKSLDRFGSLDSSDTFLSCNTHPYPSQGSLAGLEELAALGTMAANGSMPSVNIPSFNNGVCYVNPFSGEGLKKSGQPSPLQSRRVRITGRSASSDVELADFESDFSAANREAYHEEIIAPKHRRKRTNQQV